jgi:hypothetical protein
MRAMRWIVLGVVLCGCGSETAGVFDGGVGLDAGPREEGAADAAAPDAAAPDASCDGCACDASTTCALPAWRLAMTEHDRLYNVSAGPPSDANSSIVFPGGVVPYGFSTNENYGWDVMSGYSSGVLLDDVGGPFGTMVFGTGGHTRIQNQLLSLGLSEDAPTYGWFQQPYFESSDVNGAELYYNRAEFDSLPVTRRTGDGFGTEGDMTAAWLAAGGEFPMGYEGWIFPRRLVTGQLGNNHPHGFRYMAPSYIPSSMTGTGAGAYVVIEAPQGPFAQSWIPSGAPITSLVDPSAIWPSGRRRWPIWCKNVQTGEWERLLGGYQPDYPPYGYIRQHSAVARDQRRVYVSVDVGGGTAAYWYIDFADGIAGATVSELVSPTTAVAPNRGTTGAFTDGHPDGRHLWYWPDLLDANGLILQDVDLGTQTRLAIGRGLEIPAGTHPAMQYDAAGHRMIILQHGADGALVYRTVSIPTDPLDASAYVVSDERTLAVDDSVATPVGASYFYKTRLHPTLGVMFVPQDRGRMLAFRPAP